MNRRNFITAASLASCLPLLSSCTPGRRTDCPTPFVKPIVGTGFQFEHHNQAGAKHWNPTLRNFTTEQWRTLVFDMHEIGMEYLQMLSVAYEGKTYYPSALLPRHDWACEDPLEAVLSAADECGAKFFVSNDYWSDWSNVKEGMTEESIWRLREKGMREIAEKYGHHESFYGWYFPHETELFGVFNEYAYEYVNRSSEFARSLTPNALTMIAPYGTQYVTYNEKYIRQLEGLDVDIIAYQDEVGVFKINVGEAGQYFENLYKMHVEAGRSRLWAVVEIFDYEAEAYTSPGIPASFERVERQLADISPYVEHIIICQYQGFMSKPGSIAVAGREDTKQLYTDYVNWLNSTGRLDR
jgi:hypothetical protein